MERVEAGVVTKMVVIGGGLTSAQICDLAIRRGIAKVILLCRSSLKGQSSPRLPSPSPSPEINSASEFDISISP